MILPLMAIMFICCGVAHADIFRSVNEEGVECFTDAPTGKGATRIIKEKAPPRKTALKRPSQEQSTPPPTATTIANVAPTTPATLPINGRITSTPGFRRDPVDGMLRFHQGVDIATPSGTVIRPVASGTVAYSGSRAGYGNLVIVEHPDGMLTLYAHNSTNIVAMGESVDTNTTIALSGSTGRSTGPHLHFEAWKGGTNLTDSFVVVAAGGRPVTPSRHEEIRRMVQSDGSILFTNLPY